MAMAKVICHFITRCACYFLTFWLQTLIFAIIAGWRYLTLLNASASEMGTIFIPEQRAMYLVQAIRKWYQGESGERGSRQVNAQVAKLLTVVAPIIQGLSGSHWEFM